MEENQEIDLEDIQLISNEEYLKLDNPQFVGQTRLDSTNHYYMVWKVEGVLYKTYNKL